MMRAVKLGRSAWPLLISSLRVMFLRTAAASATQSRSVSVWGKGRRLAGSLASCFILLSGFGLNLDTVHAFSEAPCQVADPVRLQLNGIEYRIPAALQPYYSPERALVTRDYFPNGVRTRQYCQSPQSPPAVVDSISFPRNSLIAWAREDVDRAELISIFPLAIKRSLRSGFAVAEGGQTTPDGLFRKIVRGARFEIISIEPMFFGTIISADCGPAGTEQPSNQCTIWGRLRDGSLVMLGVLDIEKPINVWPQMLRQVEAFISSMAIGVR
jgi:hypothetical protein